MTTVRYSNLARAVFVVSRCSVSTRLRYLLLCKDLLPCNLKLLPCQAWVLLICLLRFYYFSF